MCLADLRASNEDLQDYALFMEYECDIATIDLYYFGEVSRARVANIVIACDAIICLAFILNTAWLGRSINQEQYDVDKKYVHMTDFAVRIKNLPGKEYYEKLD